MNFNKIVPSVFYADINLGLKMFVDCLGFRISHDQLNAAEPFCELDKNGVKLLLFQNKEYAEKEHPELRLETNDIDEVYKSIAPRFPELLHPNLDKVTLRPWGAKEFALLDGQLGIRIQQWGR